MEFFVFLGAFLYLSNPLYTQSLGINRLPVYAAYALAAGVYAVIYVFKAISLYRMAKKKGLNRLCWCAFVPFASTYLIGELGEQVRPFGLRIPKFGGMSVFSVMGRVHLAATIWLLLMITAPSCRGEFLKNRFIISLLWIAASILSPVAMMSSRGVACGITISAPVFDSDILRHASVISLTALLSIRSLLTLRNSLFSRLLVCTFTLVPLPSLVRNLLISGWNMTIRASTPTSSTMSMMVAVSLMPSTVTANLMRYRERMATNMLHADDPHSHLNSRKIISDISSMSRTSSSESLRNPNNARAIAIPLLYTGAKIRKSRKRSKCI